MEHPTWKVTLSGNHQVTVRAPRALISGHGTLLFREAKVAKDEIGQLIVSFAHGAWIRCVMVNDPYGNDLVPRPDYPDEPTQE